MLHMRLQCYWLFSYMIEKIVRLCIACGQKQQLPFEGFNQVLGPTPNLCYTWLKIGNTEVQRTSLVEAHVSFTSQFDFVSLQSLHSNSSQLKSQYKPFLSLSCRQIFFDRTKSVVTSNSIQARLLLYVLFISLKIKLSSLLTLAQLNMMMANAKHESFVIHLS